jgi:outer membrane protein, heavy metal efflux system
LEENMLAVVSLLVSSAVAIGTPTPDPPTVLSLSDLIREAQDQNAEVQMAARVVEANRARVPQASALPDPTLIYGVINEGRPIPFETLGKRDFSEAYVGVSQELPFSGKRRVRTDAAREGVEASRWAYETVRRRVAADVAEAYYDLYATHAALDVVAESSRLLEQVIEVARTRLSVGQASQQDVLDAEVEMSRLEERRSELAQRRAILEARLRAVLNRVTDEPFGRPSTIAPTPIAGSLNELLSRAEDQSPALREQTRMIAEHERLVDLATRNKKPDFGVNFTYHNRGSLDPFYTFGGTITLPNLYGRQRHAVAEAMADLGNARSTADGARAEVRYAVTESYQMASTADRLLRLYDEGILKQARLSLDSALAQYRVGKVEFVTLIASWRRLLDYELAYQEQLATHEKALARLAVHVGPAIETAR